MPVEIRRVPVPDRLGGADAVEFESFVEVARQLEAASWGHEDFAVTPADALAHHRNQSFRAQAGFVAWDADQAVGRAEMWWERADGKVAEVSLGVLPSHRRRGIGTRLLESVEEFARQQGRPDLIVYSDHPARMLPDTGEVLTAPAGDAELPAAVPAARFAAAQGYTLSQLERVSSLDITGRRDELSLELEALRRETPGYRVEVWVDRTPDALVDAYAAAREHMVRDVPSGGHAFDEERWNAARVREHETADLDGGTGLLVAAAVSADGEVAGYTELELPEGRPFAYQSDTLVVRRHRGHRLGMLVKLANLVALAEREPDRTRIHTWNADENEHMLAINIALGFRPTGLEAAWSRGGTPQPAGR